MPKKVKKTSKKAIKKVVSKPVAAKKISFLKKYSLPILIGAAIVLGALLYQNLLVSPNINMLDEGRETGGGGSTNNKQTTAPTPCSKNELNKGCKVSGKKCLCPSPAPAACKEACKDPGSNACSACKSSNTATANSNKGGGRPQGMPIQSNCSSDNPSACCVQEGKGSMGKMTGALSFLSGNYLNNYIKVGTINPIIGYKSGVAIHSGLITCYASESDLNVMGDKYCENLNPGIYESGQPFNGVLTCEKTCNAPPLQVGLNGKSLGDYPCTYGTTVNGKSVKQSGVCCPN